MADPLEIVGVGLGSIGTVLGAVALWQPIRHRRKDDARAVIDWVNKTANLASDMAQAWRNFIEGLGNPDAETETHFRDSERRLRVERSGLIGRLPKRLRRKVEDPAHDLMTATEGLKGSRYYSVLSKLEFRGDSPFDPTKKRFDHEAFGAWLDRTASGMLADLEDYSRA